MSGCGGNEETSHQAARSTPPGYKQLTADSGENCCASLSADGKTVVFASDRAAVGNFDIWIQNTESGPARRLTDDPARDSEPVLSRDGKWIYFTSLRDPAGIYRVAAEGDMANAELLIEEGSTPQLSPDGEWLAAGIGGVAVYNLSHAKGRRVAAAFEESLTPLWSPAGEHILFAGRQSKEDAQEWWTVPLEGGDPHDTGLVARLRKEGFSEAYPQAWLPGDAIVFAGKQGQSMTLWRTWLNKDTPAERVTDDPAGDFRAAHAAGRLVFDRWRVGLDLWSLPVDVNAGRALGPPERLTSGGSQKGSPAVSLDGKHMVYHAGRGDGVFRLMLMDLDTKREKETGPTENTFYAAMAGNGSAFLYGTGPKTGLTLFSRGVSGWRSWWTREVCQKCGMPRGVAPDGKRALLWLDREMGNRIEWVDLKSGQRTLVAHDPVAELSGPEMSPDGEWVSFVARTGATFATYAVRADGKQAARAQWQRITEPGEYQMAFWAPNGELLYLLTQHGETNLNWLEALKLNGATKQPVGAPFTVYRFEGHRGPTKDPIWNRPAAVEGRIVMELGESSQDVWLLDAKAATVQRK